MIKKKVQKKVKSSNKASEGLKSDILALKKQINKQNLIIKKHSEFLINMNNLVKKQVSAETNAKLEIFNKKILELVANLNSLFESKIDKINKQNQDFLSSLRTEFNLKSKNKQDDLFDIDLFSEEADILNQNNYFENLKDYKKNIKEEILYEIYRKEIPSKSKDTISSRLDFEFNKKLKRNKKAIIKQKMLDIVSNKKITLPELKEEIVDYNNYCSKATFYRYYHELKDKKIVSSKKEEEKQYICLPSVLEKYEKK